MQTTYQGERILTTRFFEFVSSALCDVGVIEMITRDFNHDMFDWSPLKVRCRNSHALVFYFTQNMSFLKFFCARKLLCTFLLVA